jgi:hypothetical protein
MMDNSFTKILLGMIAAMLLINFLYGVFEVRPLRADKGNEDIGRYQISSWAAQSGAYTHHNGYYIVDTTTGKVIDSKSEVHSAEK